MMLSSVILLPTFQKNVMIPTSKQDTFKVKSAGYPEILLNALTKLHCILNKETPTFNTYLIRKEIYTSIPGEIQDN
jgi:hypothetical protein